MKKHYFYVLYCADKTLYAGYTTDLIRRTNEHNSGKGAKYTALQKRRPVKMIYYEEFFTRSDATKQEARFKKLSRNEKIIFLKYHNISLVF